MDTVLTWDGQALLAVDQRALPHELITLRLNTPADVAAAITTLAVRGAPAIAVAGAFGVALSARCNPAPEAVHTDARILAGTRPTAVALRRAVQRTLARLEEGPHAVLDEAQIILREDARICSALAQRGAREVLELTERRPLRILTHCNTGGLATAGAGTALAVVKQLACRGDIDMVLVGETRPLLQGARLTAWELHNAEIPYELCVDSAGPAALGTGKIDAVIVGADRITSGGDVANKIGTYALAVSAARNRIPFIVVAPETTVDESTSFPDGVVIEQRDAAEVVMFAGHDVAPTGSAAFNPAFDVTPADLVTAIVTEERVWRPRPVTQVCDVAQDLHRRGWLDGTAGNLSIRMGRHALVTATGRSKGSLTPEDFVLVDADTGSRVSGPTPSAETAIHAAIYRASANCGAVVHAHPPFATTIAGEAATAGDDTVRFRDFEIIKGLGDPTSRVIDVPVFQNWPNVPDIARDITARLLPHPPALLIAHHGATTWGPDLETARNRMEALEALCQLQALATRRD